MVAGYFPGIHGPTVFGNSGGAAFVGPGDIVSGALAWWGCRGYSAAYSTGSNPAMDVVDSSTGLITTTINILSNGNLDDATILGLGYGVSVKKLYDQTGNGNHLTQATLAKMPALTQNALGSFPAMTFVRANNQDLGRSSIAQAQPWSLSFVAKRTGSTSNYNGILVVKDNALGSWFVNSPNTVDLEATVQITKAATESTWHAIQSVANGVSSILDVDNSSVTGNAGTSAITGGATMKIGGDTDLSDNLDGLIAEAGLWPSAFSGANITSMSANQHSYWGF